MEAGIISADVGNRCVDDFIAWAHFICIRVSDHFHCGG